MRAIHELKKEPKRSSVVQTILETLNPHQDKPAKLSTMTCGDKIYMVAKAEFSLTPYAPVSV